MNVLDRFFLWLFLLPESIYEKSGINTVQLRVILTTKLTIDNRRPASFNFGKRSEKKEINKSTLSTVVGSVFIGLMLMFSFLTGTDMNMKLTLFNSMFIFMLCVTLITDFTSVLIDIRDNQIILPKPVNDVTFLASRLLHILIRICLLIIPMTLPAMILITTSEGILIALFFAVSVVLMTVFSIFLINLIYLFILKVSTPSKFQSAIGSIQVGFMVIIMAMYQLMPKIINNATIEKIDISSVKGIFLYPPYWFTRMVLVLKGNGETGDFIFLILAFIVPVASIWVVLKYMAPSFSRKMTLITSGAVEKQKSVKENKYAKHKAGFSEWIGRKVTGSGSEFAGFQLASKMVLRSKDFKLRVYPSIGYILVFVIIFLFNRSGSLFNNDGNNVLPGFLFIIYMSSFVMTTAILQMPYSDKYKASWLFYISPVEKPGLLISGAVKCIVIYFFIPLFFVLSVLSFVLMGVSILPNLLLGFVNLITISTLLAYINVKSLPFSKLQIATSGGSGFIKSLILLVFPAVFGISHFLISGFFWVVIVFIFISMFVPWLIFDGIKNQSWERIKGD